MASLITSTDGLVLTGKPAWHGLGTVVQNAPNAFGVLDIAKLGWRVEKTPLTTQFRDETLVVPNRFATVRSDTKEVLGLVSDHYRVCQNDELACLIDRLSEDGTCPRFETAGSLRGGRDVFFLAQLETFYAGPRKTDEVQRFVLFVNSHDGQGLLQVLPTTVRVVCNNTLQAALSDGREVTGTVRHVENLEQQLENAAKHLLRVVKSHEDYADAVRALAKRKLSRDELKAFFTDAFLAIEGTRATREEKERVEARAAKQLEQWIENLERGDNVVKSTEGTAWAALNAVTYWADHQRVSTSDRTWSKVLGPAAQAKVRAQKVALALAR